MDSSAMALSTQVSSPAALFFKDVFNSPKKSTFFLLVLALSFSLFLFGVFIVNQNLSVTRELKVQDQTYSKQLESKTENNKKQAIVLKQTQDKTRRDNLTQIKSALERYYTNNDYYPATVSDLVPEYLASIPTDPESDQQYYFLSSLDQKAYTLRAILSDGKEFEIDNN